MNPVRVGEIIPPNVDARSLIPKSILAKGGAMSR